MVGFSPDSMCMPDTVYTFATHWSEADQSYVGTAREFPSLSCLADTEAEALAGIAQLVAEVLLDMAHTGEQPPARTTVVVTKAQVQAARLEVAADRAAGVTSAPLLAALAATPPRS